MSDAVAVHACRKLPTVTAVASRRLWGTDAYKAAATASYSPMAPRSSTGRLAEQEARQLFQEPEALQ
jgi:hypothetical protein